VEEEESGGMIVLVEIWRNLLVRAAAELETAEG
jgi:hypothetical protein